MGDPAIPVFFGQLFAADLQAADRERRREAAKEGAGAATGTTVAGGYIGRIRLYCVNGYAFIVASE